MPMIRSDTRWIEGPRNSGSFIRRWDPNPPNPGPSFSLRADSYMLKRRRVYPIAQSQLDLHVDSYPQETIFLIIHRPTGDVYHHERFAYTEERDVTMKIQDLLDRGVMIVIEERL